MYFFKIYKFQFDGFSNYFIKIFDIFFDIYIYYIIINEIGCFMICFLYNNYSLFDKMFLY